MIPARITPPELLRIIRLLQRIRAPFDQKIPFASSDPAWNLSLHVIESHLKGEPLAISTLVDISGLPYGTGTRRINALVEEGHLERVKKGAGRKTFYLQPSKAFYNAFIEYAEEIKRLLAETFGQRHDQHIDEYYFGGADFANEILAPSPLRAKLSEGAKDIRFLLNEDNYFVSMRNLWSDYRNNLASRNSFSLKPLQQLYQTLQTDLVKPNPEYEVVAVNMPWLGEFVERGLLRPLDGFITKDNLNPLDFHPAVWSTGNWNDKQYGIPIYCTVELLAARRDLFEAQGLAYPRTFDDVLKVGRELHDPKRDFYGIAWNGAEGMPLASTFMILMGCCGAPILHVPRMRRYYQWANMTGEQLRPNIACAEGLQVLEYLHALKEISPPDVLQMDWNRRIGAFMHGEVAMTYAWSMRAARFEYDIESVVKRKVAYLPQPKGTKGISANPIGGFLLAIPANVPDDRAELAFHGMSWMASPESMKKHVTNGFPLAPRFSVAADPEAVASSPMVRFVDTLAQKGMLCAWQRPPVGEYSQIEHILGHQIHRALRGEMSNMAALEAAQNDIDALMRARGRY